MKKKKNSSLWKYDYNHNPGGPRLCSSLGYSSRKEPIEWLLKLFSDKFRDLLKIWERSKFVDHN